MINPSMEELLKYNPNRYELVMAIAKRARDIADNAEKSGVHLKDNPVHMAIDELSEGRSRFATPEEVKTLEQQDAEELADAAAFGDGASGDMPAGSTREIWGE